MRQIIKLLLATSLFLGLSFPAQAFFGVPLKPAAKTVGSFLIKHPQALPDKEIAVLSKIAKTSKGTREIDKRLAGVRPPLPNEVLEDTFMRIAVHQGGLGADEAGKMFSRLSGVPGFRSTLHKVIGNSEVKTSGHLHELRIADSAAQNSYKVKAIGDPFDDGIKAGKTDIDILLEKNGREIAIEAKHYLPSTHIPLDKFRGDLLTLAQYLKAHPGKNVIPVFSLSQKPADEASFKLLQSAAKQHGVQLVVGTPTELMAQVRQLQRVL